MQWISITEEIEQDKTYEYDAFLSYSHKDINFVLEVMNKLENDPYNFKLCLHDRDWIPGEYIIDSVSYIFIYILNYRKPYLYIDESIKMTSRHIKVITSIFFFII